MATAWLDGGANERPAEAAEALDAARRAAALRANQAPVTLDTLAVA
jgi:hypothetical protein